MSKSLYKVILFFISLFSSSLFACSCAEVSLKEKVAGASVIFVAEVNKIEVIEKGNSDMLNGGTRHAYFKVIETLKGTTEGIPFIESADTPVCCICEAKVENSKKYLVFAYGKGPVEYSVCSATVPLTKENDYYPEAIKLLLKSDKKTRVYTGTYLMFSNTLYHDDGSSTKLHDYSLSDRARLMAQISVEALTLSNGDLLAVKTLKETWLDKEKEIQF